MSDGSGGPDQTVPLRAGEVLDAAALTVWLHRAAPHLLGDTNAPVRVSQLSGGFSNLTYRVDIGDQRLVLRRPPRGVLRSAAHDMGREHRLLTALHPTGFPVPRALAFCDDDSVLGAPFHLMEYVDGVVLRGTPPLSGDAPFDRITTAALSRTIITHLAALHTLDTAPLARAGFVGTDGYVAREIATWTERWHAAQTREVRVLDEIAAWLAAHQPPDAGAVLIHNDFKHDNLVLDPDDLTRVRAVLDWETATIGCPLMDLGTSLACWMEPADASMQNMPGIGITIFPGTFTRREFLDAYIMVAGRNVPDPVFYYVYGLFKLAVMAQQFFARYEQGLTSDPRFPLLGIVSMLLGKTAARAVESQRVGA